MSFIIRFIVTLPAGVNGGDKIHVQAPDGRLNEIIVPYGFGPGSTFTVEFADTPPPVSSPQSYSAPVVAAVPESYGNNQTGDDGFATGFNNPDFVSTTAVPATSYGQEEQIYLNSYPAPYVTAKPL